MEWSIEYYNPQVEKGILDLPPGLISRYFRLTELMIEFGANLGMPHTKQIENSLFELRIKSKEGIARVFFCTKIDKRIIMLHVFIKKTQKIPKKELNIAYIKNARGFK